jgi:hypothetical protein
MEESPTPIHLFGASNLIMAYRSGTASNDGEVVSTKASAVSQTHADTEAISP